MRDFLKFPVPVLIFVSLFNSWHVGWVYFPVQTEEV